MIQYETIKSTVSITRVLRGYGISAPDRSVYRIACPLHHGVDANFSVSENSGLWNCFSVCERGGSVIDLVAALEKISTREAAEKLSKDFDVADVNAVTLEARKLGNQVEQWRKLQPSDSQTVLPDHHPLEVGYRGLTQKTIDHWQLARSDEGILIPIVNSKGEICSYSIRTNTGKPKYRHAAGVSKYIPFGMYQNAQAIIDATFVYVVEGQFDALSLWQRGNKNVVAIMGSAMTDQQAMLLLSLTSSLMLVMDGDEAGRKASSEITKKWGKVFEIKTFDLPEGLDPDEFVGSYPSFH